MPVAHAADIDELDERDTGESIVINVDDYEPKVVPANMLEENNQPIYAFLKGYTLGTLIGEEEPMAEPFYGSPKIKKITEVKQVEHNPYTVGGVRFIPPPNKKYTLDNLGTAIITLKKIEKEHEVPDNITVNVTARVYFDAERIRGMGRQEIILTQDSDEDAWKQKNDLTDYSFWSGRGYIRASKIRETEATFEIYDGSLRTLKTLTLKKGSEPSSPIKLRYSSDLTEDQFRVQLLDIMDPLEERAEIELNVDGEISKKILKRSETLYPGSEWKLDSITEGTESGKEIEKIILEDSLGNTHIITRVIEKVDGEIVKGKDPCETARLIEDLDEWQKDKKIEDSLTKEDQRDLYCTAISEFKKVIKDYPDSKDENDVLWKDRAYYHIGLTYEKLINLFDLDEEKGYRNRAAEEAVSAFESSIVNSNGEFIADARTRLFELKEKNIKNIGYEVKAFEEDGNYIQVKLLEIKPIDETKQSQVDIRVYDTIKKGLIVGDSIDVGDWFISKISEKQVYLKRGSLEKKYSDVTEKGTGFYGVEENGEKYQWILKYEKDSKGEGTLYIKKSTSVGDKDRINLETHIVPQYKSFSDNKLYSLRAEGVEKKDDKATVTIKRTSISTEKVEEVKEETKIINLDKKEEVDGKEVKLLKVDMHKEVRIVILPGSGKEVYSDSSFMLHIPIEKRAIKLSPEKIDEQINKTEKQIEKLDKIITRLDNVIRSWKALCLITFAALTIKNSFLDGMAKSQARSRVMQGTTENPGWRAYCEKYSGYKKQYPSYDDCMLQNNERIMKEIEETQKAVADTNKQKYTADQEDIDGISIKKIREYEKSNWGDKVIDEEKARELVTLKKLSESCTNKELAKDANGNYLPNYCYTANEKYRSLLQTFKNDEDMYGKVNEKMKEWGVNNPYDETWLKKHPNMGISQYKAERDALLSAYIKAEDRKIKLKSSEKTFKIGTATNTAQSGVVKTGKDKKTYFINDNNIEYEVNKVEGAKDEAGKEMNIYKIVEADKSKLELHKEIAGENIYIYEVGGETSETVKVDSILLGKKGTGEAWINSIKYQIKEDPNNKNKFLIDYPGSTLNDKPITTDREYDLTKEYRTTYASGATAEFYEDGKPYCVPTKEGNFVKVKEYDKRGNPSIFETWNVGPDGLLCTDDDIPLLHKSLIILPGHEKEYAEAERSINLALGLKENQVINIGDKTFRISKSKALSEAAKGAPKCQDVMDPQDCAILFGVCDPVMCPTSRCDFGGRWHVENVVKTGIIGSVVLCAPNFKLPYEPVPICLTGILAGLQNIRSVLQGYVECLKTAKVHDKSVGICDKIRSVFICEILWQEAIAIWNIQGGIMSWLSDFFFGKAEGGGEYLNFQSSMQNVVESVKFFTADYAQTAFAAYNSRSLDEIGTEICKAAIFGKVPGMGDFFDQLTAPESPPQFTAVLSEMPWAESQKLSRYNVYYHIYAGEAEDIKYSVFIKNKFGDIVYATERENGRRSTIEKGKYADFSVDFAAKSGYDQVCVEINGKTTCGVGKASSEFALNYLDNLLVKDEVERKIKSEEQCVPDNPRASPSLASLVMPGQPGLLSTGIVRVCSIQNPGQGTNPQDWKPVGSCGKDSEGHYLGTCWIDERTISIKDLKMREEIAQELGERGMEYTKEQFEPYITLDEPEISEGKLNDAEQKVKEKQDWITLVSTINEYKSIILRSKVPAVSVEAQFNIAKIYTLLAEAKPEKQEETAEEKEEIIEKKEEEEKVEFIDLDRNGEEFVSLVKNKEVYIKFNNEKYKILMKDISTEEGARIQVGYEEVLVVREEQKQFNLDGSDDYLNLKLGGASYAKNEAYITLQKTGKREKDTITTPFIIANCEACSDWGSEAGILCSYEECHSIGDCYIEKSLFKDKCLHCKKGMECSDFNNQEECKNNGCSIKHCIWTNEKCQLSIYIYEIPTGRSLKFMNIATNVLNKEGEEAVKVAQELADYNHMDVDNLIAEGKIKIPLTPEEYNKLGETKNKLKKE